MNITNRLFTYPVLSDETNDYKDCSFEVDVEQKDDEINSLSLVFNIHLDSKYLLSLIRDNKAEYVIHIECTTTAYRTVLKSISSTIETSIPIEKLNGKVELMAFLIAKQDFEYYSSTDWDEDYSDYSFDLQKGSILAYQNLEDFVITKDFEEFSDADSIISVYKILTSDTIPMKIDLEGNKIRIGLAEKDYSHYINYYERPTYQPILNSMIVLPALVYVFEELKQEGGIEKYRTRNWFNSIDNSYKKRDVDFEKEINEKKSIQLAQEVLSFPINKALGQIRVLDSIMPEEDEE